MSEDEFPVLNSAQQIRVTVRREKVVVRPWKATVWVQELTGEELDEYKQAMYERDLEGSGIHVTLEKQNLRLCAFAIRDENGNRLFPNTERGVAELGKKPASGTELLAKVANALNSGSEEEIKKIEGNFVGERTDSSPSGSPSLSVAPTVNS